MSELPNRVPPSSLEAEQSILGAMLLSEDACLLSVEKLAEDDFYSEQHRRIWCAMRTLVSRSKPVDIVTVTSEMEQRAKLSLEELTYITALTERVPSVKNLTSYINIVREKSLLRKLLNVSTEITGVCFSGELSATDALNRASELIFKLSTERSTGGLVHIKGALEESYAQISAAAANKGKLMGIPTGFSRMDKMLSGLQPTQLIIVAGRPGMGKTSFALNIAEYVGINVGKPVCIFSLEMGREQLAMRLMCAGAKVDSQKARVGELAPQDYFDLSDAMMPIGTSQIYVDDNSAVTPADIVAEVRRLSSRVGEIGLVVIDYLQLMSLGTRSESRQNEVAELSRSLKRYAKELKVPIILLSQLSRANEKRTGDKKPMLSDLRESGSIEQDADVVIFLHREEYYNKEDPNLAGKAVAIIAKQRSGPTGEIEMVWKGEQTKYIEVDYAREAPVL